MNLLHKKSILDCTELEERIHQAETNQYFFRDYSGAGKEELLITFLIIDRSAVDQKHGRI